MINGKLLPFMLGVFLPFCFAGCTSVTESIVVFLLGFWVRFEESVTIIRLGNYNSDEEENK